MDHDDNDFQSQNLHLAGESSNKYPPVLQPYALPKFDFDDNLNGHLRFDSLVETEVFLGIEGNEDSRWIEDFSRGSSSVVFSSSVAESCAILRHNNVWSEATSSESVEMLLKSVGQDDVIARESTNKESGTCDELGCIIEHMEPSQKHEMCDNNSKVEAVDIPPTLSADKTSGNSDGFKEDGGELHLPENASQADACELSGEGKSIIPSTAAENSDIIFNLQKESPDAAKNSVDQSEIDTEVTDFLIKQEEKGNSESRVQVDAKDHSVYDVTFGRSELNDQNALQLKDDTSYGLENRNYTSSKEEVLVDNSKIDGNSEAVKAHFDSPACLISKAESMEAETLGHTEEHDTKLQGTSDLLVTEGCGQDLIILAKASSTDSEPAGQDIQVSHTHASYTVESVVEQVACGGRTATDERTESCNQHEIDESEHEATISSLEERTTSEGKTVPSLVCSSTELLEPCAIKSSETCAAKHTAPESTKICSDDVLAVRNETNVGSPHISGGPEQIIELAFDRSAMDHSTDDSLAAGIGIVSQSVGTGSGGTTGELEEQKSESDAIVVDNSGIDIDQNGLQTTPDLAEEVKHLEKEEADADIRSSSEDLLVTKTSPNATAEQSHVSESEKAGQTLACGQLLSEKAGTTLVVIDSFNSDSQSGQQTAKLSKESASSTHTSEISPAVIVHEPKEIEAGNTEGRAVSEKPKEAISKGDHEAELHGESESEPIQNKDSPQLQVGAASFGDLGNVSGTGSNGQLESNSASSLNDLKAQVVMPSMKCDAFDIEMGGSSGASTASESTIKSHVPESGNISTGLESPSPTHITIAKTSDLPVEEANNKIVKIHEVQNVLPSTLDDSQGVKGNIVTSGERSLSFDATPFSGLSVNKDGKNLQHAASVQVSIGSPIVGSPSTPSLEKTDSNTTKGVPERKSRRTSRAAGKETSKKGKSAKETTASRQIHSGSKTRIAGQTSPLAGQIVQSIQTANIRPLATFSTSVSSIPDLNSSTLSAVFQRPFTDLQQVQLRAQIFVYGALIQGTPPDEAYMVSAFGGPDGGKSSWENAWRVCMERAQKSHIASPETPMHLRSGVRAPDQTMKSTLQGKISSPLVGQTSGKDASAVNPVMSLSSPLWGMSTPRDTLRSSSALKGAVSDHRSAPSSLHLLQTPSIKNHVGHNTPWLLPSPYAGPWVASSQTNAFDTGARFSGFPTVEAVRLTPEKESLLPLSGANHLSKDHIIQSATSSSSAPKGTPAFDPKNVIVSPGQHTSATKPRKRKKLPVSTEAVQITLHSQPQTLPFSAPVFTSFALTSASITNPVNPISKSAQEKLVPCLSPHVLTGHGVPGNRETEQRSALSEETLSKLKVARMHAEDASALAAAALSDSEYVWKQMERKSDSRLEPEIQRKLASATVAIAAAAAVAKAASAAANVAANAALQAKLMAEEVFDSDRGNATYFSEGNRSLGQATPSSILKGDGASVSSNSFLFAARETARKRVEVATAATKRAENIDAIVKAAELAAEAVSQAGKLVTMGDPLSLNELIEANPDNCWKPAQSVVESEPCRGGSFENKEAQVNSRGTSAGPRDVSTALDDHGRLVDSLSGSVSATIKRIKGDKDYKGIIHSPKTVAVVSEPEAALKSLIDSQTESEQITEASKEKIFEEGSNVEVFKEGLGWRKAWYSANILSLRNGEAYVSYTELSSDKGAEKLKEWVAFKDESGAPKIRIARPITAIPFEGTRKRRRAAIGDYNWSVGDKVDAWVHDSWWEGIVTEKNKKDETTLTVHFPAQGETLTVKAWHLRASLFWKDGKWIEYAGVGGSNSSHEGDTPNEKRARFVSPAREAKKEEKSSKNFELPDSQKSQQPLLQLTASDKAFSIGKTTKDDNNLDPPRMKRTGLQKQGSRVIFGVPKPGKKRKFMEVSKHYVTGSSDKTSEPGDSVKFTKYLMPQASASRAWGRNIPKSDPKEKQAAVSKPKVFKPAVSKPKEKRNALATMVPQKQESLNADVDSDSARDQTNKVSVSNSSAGEASESQTSSHSVSLGGFSKRAFSVSSEAEHANKGKAAHPAGRLAKIEENKVLGGVNEPRRSNRRIQPTSRLLEGLQTSSMIASKIPSVSHGKGHPNQNKNGSRGK